MTGRIARADTLYGLASANCWLIYKIIISREGEEQGRNRHRLSGICFDFILLNTPKSQDDYPHFTHIQDKSRDISSVKSLSIIFDIWFRLFVSGLLSPIAKSVALIARFRKIILKCAVNGKRSITMEFPVGQEAGFYFLNDI